MRIAVIAAICLVMAGTSGFAQTSDKKTDVNLKSRADSISYLIGMSFGKNLKAQSIDIDVPLFVAAFEAVKNDKPLLLTDAQAQMLMMSFQAEMGEKHAAMQKEAGAKNAKEGEAFLAENKTKPGVKSLPDGLQYKVIKEGTGPKPTSTDKVRVHYSGTLINGKEFDSSYKRGQPAEFGVTGVIKGWTEALQLMPVGSKWMLYIPPALAYGENGAGGDIGPNATLVFEVELLDIIAPDKDAAAPAKPKLEIKKK